MIKWNKNTTQTVKTDLVWEILLLLNLCVPEKSVHGDMPINMKREYIIQPVGIFRQTMEIRHVPQQNGF